MPNEDAGRKPRRQWAPDARALGIVGDRWVMVIVRDLASGPLRLDALRRWLPGVSAGALEARLVRMADEGLLVRSRHRSLPPRVDLELTDRGHALAGVISELARWELRTQWSQPHEDEWVDVAACFRLAPFLETHDDDRTSGQVALTIANASGTQLDSYTFIRDNGRTRIEHQATPNAQARITGTQSAWVQALSPGTNTTKLEITGNKPLAQAFLSLFTPKP